MGVAAGCRHLSDDCGGPCTWINNNLLATRGLVVKIWFDQLSVLILSTGQLLSFIRIVNGTAPSPATAAFAILLSFALAWLTYLVIEKPLKFRKTGVVESRRIIHCNGNDRLSGVRWFMQTVVFHIATQVPKRSSLQLRTMIIPMD